MDRELLNKKYRLVKKYRQFKQKTAMNAIPSLEISNFVCRLVSLPKRFGRLRNKEASEPGGAEAIVFLGG